MIDYTILETHEMNLQKVQYDSVKRVINYCYEFIPYLSKDNNDIKDCTIALDKINSFFQTKQKTVVICALLQNQWLNIKPRIQAK